LKLSKIICKTVAGALELAICKQDWMKAGREGVVTSRTRVGYSLVRMKMRVRVMMHSFFEDGGSGFVKIARRPRTQGRHF
jgi:hypothetical protein